MFWVEFDHFRGDFVTFVNHIFNFAKWLVGKLGNVDQGFNAIVELTNAPKCGCLSDYAFDKEPTGSVFSMVSQGFLLSCLTPRVIFLLSLSTERTTASTLSPFFKTSEGWETFFDPA